MTTTATTTTTALTAYQVLAAPPIGTCSTFHITHNIALRLFNRDSTSPIQSIEFGALQRASGILFARTSSSPQLLYLGGHTTKNPGLYSSTDGALIEEHLCGVCIFTLLDLYSRPEGQLPRGFDGAPREQWAASFVVVDHHHAADDARKSNNTNNALTVRVRFASPFAITQDNYLEAEYTLHALHHYHVVDEKKEEDTSHNKKKRARTTTTANAADGAL